MTPVRCANCGTENEAGKEFCSNCGARLADAGPSAARIGLLIFLAFVGVVVGFVLLPLLGLWGTALGQGDFYRNATRVTVLFFVIVVVLSFAGLVGIFGTRRGRALPPEFRAFAIAALTVVFGGMSICSAASLPGLFTPR